MPRPATARKKEEVPNLILFIGHDPAVSRPLEECLAARNCTPDYAAGSADALRHLRQFPYDVVITDPRTSIEEDLALLAEMRQMRPGVRTIVLAPTATPEDVIAALRARVFVCLSPPFDASEIAEYASRAATDAESLMGIEVVSAQPDWVTLRLNCQLLSAERVISFMKELRDDVPRPPREQIMTAFREILLNAVEHGGGSNAGKVIEVAAVHSARAIVFYVHDPGTGFHWEGLPHAAVSNPPDDPTAHMAKREEEGMRPGGYGILLARGVVDELMYSEVGNEVLLIKHLR